MKKLLLLLAALAALTAVASASVQKLVIKGSDTLGAKLVPTLAEEYKSKNPGVSFEIAAEGSTTGIAAVIDGTAQIGMSSRRAKPTEVSAASAKGVSMKPTIVAFDGIAIIVNAASPITGDFIGTLGHMKAGFAAAPGAFTFFQLVFQGRSPTSTCGTKTPVAPLRTPRG